MTQTESNIIRQLLDNGKYVAFRKETGKVDKCLDSLGYLSGLHYSRTSTFDGEYIDGLYEYSLIKTGE